SIYTVEPIDDAPNWTLLLNNNPVYLERVTEVKKRISPKQVATIIYTSGTTGTPKGVMLSHENIYANLQFSKESFPFPDAPQMKILSFLPLNHILEKMASYIFLFSGIGIYYAESFETIAENLREI